MMPFGDREIRRFGIQSDCLFAYLQGQITAQPMFRLRERDILVVSALRALVEGVKIAPPGSLRSFPQPGRKLNAADRAGLLVVLPAGTRDITANNGFYWQRLQPLDDKRAASHLIALAVSLRRIRVESR